MTSQLLRPPTAGLWLILLGYLLTVVALSLHPFEGWRDPPGPPWAFLLEPLPRWRTQFDLWTNLLAYLPLGLLFAACLRGLGGRRGPLLALMLCMLISLCLESTQSYLPTRRAQWLDLLANSVGAGLGCLAWAASQGGRMMRRPTAWESVWTEERPVWLDSIGIWGLMAVWLLAQAAPMGLWLQLGGGHSDWLTSLVNPLPGSLIEPDGRLGGAGQILVETCLVGLNLSGLALLISLALDRRSGGSVDGSFRPWGRLVLLVLLLSLLARFFWGGLLHPSLQIQGFSADGLQAWIPQFLSAGVQAGLFLALLLAAAGLALPPRPRALACLGLLGLALLLVKTMPPVGLEPQLTEQWSLGRWQNLRGATQLAALAWPWLAMAWAFLWLSRGSTPRVSNWAHKMRR